MSAFTGQDRADEIKVLLITRLCVSSWLEGRQALLLKEQGALKGGRIMGWLFVESHLCSKKPLLVGRAQHLGKPSSWQEAKNRLLLKEWKETRHVDEMAR